MPQFPFKGSVMPGWQRKLLYAIILLNIVFLAFQLAVYLNNHTKSSSIFYIVYALLLIAYCVIRLRTGKKPRHYIAVEADGMEWNFPLFAAPEKINWSALQGIRMVGNTLMLWPKSGEAVTIDLQQGFDAPAIQSIQSWVQQQAKANQIRVGN